MRNIEVIKYGTSEDDQPTIHFAHANGFHPDTYLPLFDHFVSRFNITAPLLMPFDPDMVPSQLTTWKQLADEVDHSVREYTQSGVIGMGHSLGAIVSLIANHDKQLFKALVLIEPVLLPMFAYRLLAVTPHSLRTKVVPVAKVALKRRDRWDSVQDAKQYLRKKSVFAGINDKHFDQFIASTIIETESGDATLRYSKQWEAQTYATVYNPYPLLKKINIPIMIIRGEHSNVIQMKTWKNLKDKFDHIEFIELPNSGHLAPFEKPKEVSQIILDFISRMNV